MDAAEKKAALSTTNGVMSGKKKGEGDLTMAAVASAPLFLLLMKQ